MSRTRKQPYCGSRSVAGGVMMGHITWAIVFGLWNWYLALAVVWVLKTMLHSIPFFTT